jgi:signal peptidase II
MRRILLLFSGISIFSLDIFTKYLASHFLVEPIWVIPDVFSLEYHKNTGIAFSIPLPRILQISFSLFFLLFFLLYAKRNFTSHLELYCVSGVVSGAMGNLVERIFFGSVTDFLSFWSFPVFNIADIAIFLGVTGLILLEIKKNTGKEKDTARKIS